MPSVEPLGHVRTKIVATVGPASCEAGTLRALIDAGVDVVRLNFSHGSHADHTEALATVRRVAEEADRVVGVLMDLCGPKIRLGPLPGDAIDCHEGEIYHLLSRVEDPENPRQLTCTYEGLTEDLKIGEAVFFADGAVAMQVLETDGEHGARLEVTLPGRIRSRQGINLPGTELRVDALTSDDYAALDWAAEHEVDFVGLSFVRRAADVVALREALKARGIRAHIVAKIEKPQAVLNLDEILAATDAVMVARGDLGVELDVARVPAIQKQIIAACHQARVPVITATQMLASMESSTRPTRAETSDVFNAILDGTDAVMLSGETAIGAYPVAAVSMMSRIAAEAERLLEEDGGFPIPKPPEREDWVSPVTEGLVEAASLLGRRLDARLLIAATHTGRTVLAASKYRNKAPTLALADNSDIVRRMSLYWGVTPLYCTCMDDPEELLRHALGWARERSLLHGGDRVVLLRGATSDSPVHNALLVHEEPR